MLTSERVSLSHGMWGIAGVKCGFIAFPLLWGTVSSFFLLIGCSIERMSVKYQYLPFHAAPAGTL